MSASIAFHDVHFHALTLSHPNFLSFVDTMRNRRLESIFAQASSPNYLVGALFLKGGERIRNMLAVMENDVGSIFCLMEDDLLGRFAKPGDGPALLSRGELGLGRLRFDRLVAIPLIMDFEMPGLSPSDTYYDKPPAKKVGAQVRDVLAGIRDYRRLRPEGFLELRPFLGVNTRNHSEASLAALLESSFRGYRRGKEASHKAFLAMADWDECEAPMGECLFAGIKVYPPLGFDPWPAPGPERDKVELLYSFCERHDLPITSHCDDQGFRVIPLEEAWTYTSPRRWRAALLAHPDLRLDLAHFGAQYSLPIGRGQVHGRGLSQVLSAPTDWAEEVVALMGDFPKVYTDISFNGSDPAYYGHLLGLLSRFPPALRELAADRIMFGSDFLVNLTKVRSYSDYYRHFADSSLSDEWKRRFGHDNPEAFLFG
jgi:predicted TIM-barrel fold metal-dependent hydrolase